MEAITKNQISFCLTFGASLLFSRCFFLFAPISCFHHLGLFLLPFSIYIVSPIYYHKYINVYIVSPPILFLLQVTMVQFSVVMYKFTNYQGSKPHRHIEYSLQIIFMMEISTYWKNHIPNKGKNCYGVQWNTVRIAAEDDANWFEFSLYKRKFAHHMGPEDPSNRKRIPKTKKSKITMIQKM